MEFDSDDFSADNEFHDWNWKHVCRIVCRISRVICRQIRGIRYNNESRDRSKNETIYIRRDIFTTISNLLFRIRASSPRITATYSFSSNLRTHFITNTGNCWVGIVYCRKKGDHQYWIPVCADTRWNTSREGHRFSFPSIVCSKTFSLKKQIGSRYICSSTPDIFSIANFSLNII